MICHRQQRKMWDVSVCLLDAHNACDIAAGRFCKVHVTVELTKLQVMGAVNRNQDHLRQFELETSKSALIALL